MPGMRGGSGGQRTVMEDKRAVYAALYARLHDELLGWCKRRVRDGCAYVSADDLSQATWARVWQHLDRYTETHDGNGTAEGRIKTWVYTVARRIHIDLMRHERVVVWTSLDRTVGTGWHPVVDDIAIAVQDRFEAVNASATLTAGLAAEHLDLLRLAGSDMTRGEIATLLRLSPDQVKARLSVARGRAFAALGIPRTTIRRRRRHRYTARYGGVTTAGDPPDAALGQPHIHPVT